MLFDSHKLLYTQWNLDLHLNRSKRLKHILLAWKRLEASFDNKLLQFTVIPVTIHDSNDFSSGIPLRSTYVWSSCDCIQAGRLTDFEIW